MANFISDEEMRALEANQKSPDFISDEDMTKLESGKPWYDVSVEGLGRSAIESLPLAGAAVGGVVGSFVTPVAGTIAGSGIGAMAGKSLEQAGKKLFFDEGPQTRAQQYTELAQEGLAGASGEAGGQVAGKALEKGLTYAAAKGLPKTGHALTGVSEQEIKTYAQRADQVKKMANESNASTLEAADLMREQFNKDIDTTTKNINDALSKKLNASTKKINSEPIYDALEKYKSELNPNLYIEEIKQIDDLQTRVLNATSGDKIPIGLGNDIKQYLQNKAKSAYRNGDMFQIGTEAANAAKGGAAKARALIDAVEPEVTELNSTLAKFHDIENSMNQNLLKVGSPEAALITAGTGLNERNVSTLKKLGELTGTPMLEQAQNLAAMRTFNNPPFLPVDTTGKSALRTGLAAGVGAIFGGPTGGAMMTGLTSPFALKGMIEAGRAAKPVIEKVMPAAPTREMIYKGLIQKYMEPKKSEVPEETPKIKPTTSTIMEKVKGSPYEQLLNNSLKNGGEQSFAAANYVLKNRDENYRKLFEEGES